MKANVSKALFESWFTSGLEGASEYMGDGKTRARWVVADALRVLAKKEDRSMAARLRILAGDIENGIHPTKRVIRKIGPKRLDAAFREFERLAQSKNAKGES